MLKGKRVLVTGASGFLGQHVVKTLEKYDLKDLYCPSSEQCNLISREIVWNYMIHVKPDIIIHLAAVVGGIGANRRFPGDFFYENAMMGLNLMEIARCRSVEKFVNIGTICSYPKNTPVPFKEEDLWNGYPEETNAPYGLAKKMLLVQGQAYRQQYGFNAITLLPVNLYGPGDNYDTCTSHVIPALIRKIHEAEVKNLDHIEVWGTGECSREFLFVRDAAEGICMAADSYDKGDPINLGTGREIKIRDLALLICTIMGYKGKIVFDTSKPDGQPRRCLDVTKAKEEFGFEAKTSLEDGLLETIKIYKDNNES
jgi:GDP-L-fucose synthase